MRLHNNQISRHLIQLVYTHLVCVLVYMANAVFTASYNSEECRIGFDLCFD